MSRSVHRERSSLFLLTALLLGALSGCGSAGSTGPGATSPHTADIGASASASAETRTSPPATAPSVSPSASPAPSSTGDRSPAAAAAAAGRMQDPTSEVEASTALAVPTRVTIPAIGVDAPLEILSVDEDDMLQPPVEWDAAGWYDRSPVPGERGPAVLAGHLVGPSEPAVFVALGALVPGDVVTVDRADGTSATFAVDRTISAERTGTFPTSEIYGPTPDAQLRLITCDGEYDPSRGHWTRNMVVFASQVTG